VLYNWKVPYKESLTNEAKLTELVFSSTLRKNTYLYNINNLKQK